MKLSIHNPDSCSRTMDRFLELDKNERIPLSVTLHLLFCSKCRTQVRRMTQAECLIAAPLKIATPLTDDTIENVLKAAQVYNAETMKSPISLTRWIVSGILMIVLLIAFGIITRSSSSEELMLIFYLMFALLVTGYCALFVGCNMDFFVKKIETLHLGQPAIS